MSPADLARAMAHRDWDQLVKERANAYLREHDVTESELATVVSQIELGLAAEILRCGKN